MCLKLEGSLVVVAHFVRLPLYMAYKLLQIFCCLVEILSSEIQTLFKTTEDRRNCNNWDKAASNVGCHPVDEHHSSCV